MKRRGALAGAFLSAVILGSIAIGTACSNQGEGERCEAQNGNDDCQSGLTCFTSTELGNQNHGDRCCPPDRSRATTAACMLALTPPDSGVDGSLPPPTTGSETPDATSDADGAETGSGDGGEDANPVDGSDQ